MWELLNVENGYFWVIVGVGLIILETILGSATFALASLGAGAIITGFLAFAGVLCFNWLLVVFAVVSVVLFVVSRPLAHRILTKTTEVKTNVDAMVGRVGVVTSAIRGTSKPGYVKLAGDEWRSFPSDGAPIPEEAEVVIERVEGATLFVKVLQTEKEEA